MRNDPEYDLFQDTDQVIPIEESGVSIPKGKALSAIDYLNMAGVLMRNNGLLRLGLGSYYITSADGTDLIQIMSNMPHRVISVRSNETLDLRSLITETMSNLKDWVKQESISKRLLGQTALMTLACDDFNRDVFYSVIKNKVTLSSFIENIKLGNGIYDEEMNIFDELPDFLKDAIKEIV